ncbi:hypothetical protein HDU99_000385 [Rhizoclosmatium hyalinum]|nr:hypothetical protein HDU99_000385 [Rhizoclosmatium hyalinum]
MHQGARIVTPRLVLVPVEVRRGGLGSGSEGSEGKEHKRRASDSEVGEAESAAAASFLASKNHVFSMSVSSLQVVNVWVLLRRSPTHEPVGLVQVAGLASSNSDEPSLESAESSITLSDELGVAAAEDNTPLHFSMLGDASCPSILPSIIDSHCGNGYATEATKAILLHLFKSQNPPDRIQSFLDCDFPMRENAENMLLRLGFAMLRLLTPSMNRNSPVKGSWAVWEVERLSFLELWAS